MKKTLLKGLSIALLASCQLVADVEDGIFGPDENATLGSGAAAALVAKLSQRSTDKNKVADKTSASGTVVESAKVISKKAVDASVEGYKKIKGKLDEKWNMHPQIHAAIFTAGFIIGSIKLYESQKRRIALSSTEHRNEFMSALYEHREDLEKKLLYLDATSEDFKVTQKDIAELDQILIAAYYAPMSFWEEFRLIAKAMIPFTKTA